MVSSGNTDRTNMGGLEWRTSLLSIIIAMTIMLRKEIFTQNDKKIKLTLVEMLTMKPTFLNYEKWCCSKNHLAEVNDCQNATKKQKKIILDSQRDELYKTGNIWTTVICLNFMQYKNSRSTWSYTDGQWWSLFIYIFCQASHNKYTTKSY